MRNQCRPEFADSELSFVQARPLLSLDAVVCDFPPTKRPLHADSLVHAFDVSSVGARRAVLVLEKDQSTIDAHERWWADPARRSGSTAKHAIVEIDGSQFRASYVQLAGEIALDSPGKLREVTSEWILNSLVKANNLNRDAADLGLTASFQPSLSSSSWSYGQYDISPFGLLTESKQAHERNSVNTYIKLLYWLIAGIDLFSDSTIEPSLLSKWAPAINVRTAEHLRAAFLKPSMGADFSELISDLSQGVVMPPAPLAQEPPALPSTIKGGFSRLAGMRSLKHDLLTHVVSARKDKSVFDEYGIQPISSLLLIGPSGCGKTQIARCLADELGYFTIQVRPSDVASVYVRETVVRLREYFDEAVKNRPCVLFFDEFNGLVPDRESLVGMLDYKIEEVNEILTQLDLAKQNQVFVIAASNHPFAMDPGVFRSGRFDKIIYVPAPDEDDRVDLLKCFLKGRPTVTDLDLTDVAARLDGYSAADVKTVVEESARLAVSLGRVPISKSMLLEAQSRVAPSITTECEKRFEKFIARGYSN